MNRVRSILWGLVLIVIGVIFALNSLDVTNINLLFEGWWTLFIIVPSFIGLFKNNDKTGNVVGLIIGIILLLASQDYIKFDMIWKLLVPCILIIIGISIIFKDIFRASIKKEINKLNKNNQKEYCATFGGQDVRLDNEEFTGCNLSAVFGGVRCDISNAKIKNDCVINVSAIFGGVDIIIPDNVNVKVSSVPIFGGVSNSRKAKNKDGQKTIYVNATSMFGGTEIK